MSILKILARQILDSRGNPTVEVDVITGKGLYRASVPSGASKGRHEATEIRDNVKKVYMGKGVQKAVRNVNEIIGPAIVNEKFKVTQQRKIDKYMVDDLDGTTNKSHLGANAILGVSLAVLKAGAGEKGLPIWRYLANISNRVGVALPVPAFNVINGGKHAGNRLHFEEFMIIPVGATSFSQALRMGTETYHHLREIIIKRYGICNTNVGDEGGFAPNIKTANEALDLLVDAIKAAGYCGKIKIGLSAAASGRYRNEKYEFEFDARDKQTKDQMCNFYFNLISKYPIISIEDPFDQDDLAPWTTLKSNAGIQIVSNDMTATNKERLKNAINVGACNCLLLNMSQVGTLTEVIENFKLARRNGMNVMVSHRSGDTEDSIIADIAVGLKAAQIKTGAPCRSERLAKYNQLLRIEEQLGDNPPYLRNIFKRFEQPRSDTCSIWDEMM